MQISRPWKVALLLALTTITTMRGQSQERFQITTTSPLPQGAVGSWYYEGVTSNYDYYFPIASLTGGSLPPGVSLDQDTRYKVACVLIGTPTSPGIYSFTIKLEVPAFGSDSRTFTLTVNPPLTIVTESLPAGTIGGTYACTLSAAGGLGPRSWAVGLDTPPPPGLSLREDGVLYGFPTNAGSFDFNVLVTDSLHASTMKPLSLPVNPAPSITTRSLPAATINVAYSTALQASGGTSPLRWTISAGSLPKGFSLASGGTISGQLSEVADTKVQITATDVNGVASTVNYEFIVRGATSALEEEALPAEYALGQNYPNPFNPTSEIWFGLPSVSHVRISLYNTLGQLLRVLLDEQREAGTHTVTLDAARLPSGLYYYAMEAGGGKVRAEGTGTEVDPGSIRCTEKSVQQKRLGTVRAFSLSPPGWIVHRRSISLRV